MRVPLLSRPRKDKATSNRSWLSLPWQAIRLETTNFTVEMLGESALRAEVDRGDGSIDISADIVNVTGTGEVRLDTRGHSPS